MMMTDADFGRYSCADHTTLSPCVHCVRALQLVYCTAEELEFCVLFVFRIE